MMHFSICRHIGFFTFVVMAGLQHVAVAENSQLGFPRHPMKIVVPFPAGGYSDALARLIALDLSTTFGQPVVVDNRPGAGGNIGADVVAKSPPDGHTLVMGTIGTQVINPLIYSRMRYNAAADFAPVAFVADAETVLVVNPDLRISSVEELVSAAKQNPGGLMFASGGTGTTSHLAGELFKEVTDMAITHVPYKGNAPAIIDVANGQVAMSFATLLPALPFINNKQLIPLATLGKERAAILPDIPTLSETGIDGMEVRNWTGLLAPAGTQQEILQRLADQVDKTMQSPQVQSLLMAQGLNYTKMGPEEFRDFILSEAEKWGKVVREVGVKAD